VDGRKVHTDMEMWTEVRRKVFVEGASKRSIKRDYRVSARTLEKILANPEPPGYRQRTPRPKPRLGQFIGIIEEILMVDRDALPFSISIHSAPACRLTVPVRGFRGECEVDLRGRLYRAARTPDATDAGDIRQRRLEDGRVQRDPRRGPRVHYGY
jgi:hypothetical protein